MKIIQTKRRKSYRLRHHDYSSDGFYFVTICVKNLVLTFGEISNGNVMLNDAGITAREEWTKTPKIRKNVRLDEFIIMPNHIHGIIQIDNSLLSKPKPGRGVLQYAPTYGVDPKFISPQNNLGSMIRGFKSSTTKRIRSAGLLNFQWQRNYYDRVVRNEKELSAIRDYIKRNPLHWDQDKYHPENI